MGIIYFVARRSFPDNLFDTLEFTDSCVCEKSTFMDLLLSDFDSFSESSSSDDQEDIESLYGGRARSIFSSLEESIEKIDDFLMFERGFSYGDIVCSASDPSGQMGKIVNVDMTVDLENVNGLKMHDMNSRDLRKIRSVSVGDYVMRGPWLGKVEKIIDRLTVVFDDGTTCQLSANGPDKIVPVSRNLTEDLQLPFYPGQRVRIESSVSRPTRWCGIRKDKNEHGTVCNVDAGTVYVDWLTSCVGPKDKMDPARPAYLQDSRDLSVLLSGFTQAGWQLGDWCVLRADCGAYDLSFHQIAVIAKTRTKVDVQWQDGTRSMGLDSHLLFPINIVDAHDFWPNGFVLEKGTGDDSRVQKWGFIGCVDPKERTLKVKWFSEPDEEIVSAYELVEHSDYAFGPGEVVFRMAGSKMVENGENRTENIDNKFLTCFGTVIGLKNGYVEVRWGTGATSKVAPNEIFRVEKCEGPTVSGLDNENVQPPNDELRVKDQKLKDVFGLNHDNANANSSSGSITRVAIGIFNSITSRLYGSMGYKRASEDEQIDEKNSSEVEAIELCNLNRGSQFQMVEDDLEIHEKISSPQIKEANDIFIMSPSSSELPEPCFRMFDMVNDPSDHHFVNENGTDMQVKRGWLKKVNQEWSILEKDLPETIYVRAYEERMDLIRAAIIGSAGTPYHDGLFFFDIYLPPQYPNEPPMVHYISGGLRMNPNLYESGKVCLSLLNTWAGSESEVWNPSSSTILQVLLSIQALVLNEKPYFNEAGYDTQVGKAEGEKNSVSYNENAFLVSCRSMLYLLRKPPKHFGALVDEHFGRHSNNILSACKAYMQGAPIGHPFDSEKCEQETQKESSTGFKIMLEKLYTRLVESFSDKGFDCNDLSDQVP
ncbi:hypothetical protein CASFOL_040737 [Castilleja foliolosa]|uniref:E2 ubiquitin-conjugating enzyme n=1 Tax=Castilleja foliolosa TaxID=1961234 RepID=A0ABD3BDC1_9LAMI